MRKSVYWSILVLLAGVGAGRAQTPDTFPSFAGQPEQPAGLASEPLVSGPGDTSEGSAAPGDRFWIKGDYLLWGLEGERLPPLITTSPSGTPRPAAGVLGQPATQVLFGNERVNEDLRSGGRIAAGYWLDAERTWGIEGYFFMLESRSRTSSATSGGDPNLERPFFNTALGRPDAETVAFPGVLAGTVTASAGSENLLGAGLLLRKNLLECTWGGCGCFRLDALGGYRYLHLEERLGILENLRTTSPTSTVPVGSLLTVSDAFNTHNDFHGADLGLAAEFRRGRWSLDVLGKLALGGTLESANISGFTAVSTPASSTSVLPGGLLAQVTNIGHHADSHFSLVPELNVTLGYQLTERVRLSAGYTFLYWTDIARPGDQVDLNVNPNLLPPTTLQGAARPAFEFNRTGMWAQGITVGLEFRF